MSLRQSNEEGPGFKAKMKLDVGKLTRQERNYGILPSMGTLGLLGMVDAFDELIHNNMQDTKHSLEDIERISGEAMREHLRIAGRGNRSPGEGISWSAPHRESGASLHPLRDRSQPRPASWQLPDGVSEGPSAVSNAGTRRSPTRRRYTGPA